MPLVRGSAPARPCAQRQKTITAVMQADVKIFDPIVNTADITSRFALMVFDTLFSLDQNLVPQPQMVGKYEISADGLTYTFILRDGLKFHDGTPVTAEDVVASLKRWWVKDGGGQIIQKYSKELTAVDDKTIRLVLTQPYGLVLDTLGEARRQRAGHHAEASRRDRPQPGDHRGRRLRPFQVRQGRMGPRQQGRLHQEHRLRAAVRAGERLRRRQGRQGRPRRMGGAARPAIGDPGAQPRPDRLHREFPRSTCCRCSRPTRTSRSRT